ncbi:MAG: transposase [Chitinophagales bacterium]
MPNTYTQLYVHAVIVISHRNNIISPEWEIDLYKYMSGIITNKRNKSILVNGYKNHVHLLYGQNPGVCISDTLRDVKNNSTNFLNKNFFIGKGFSWQEGFGAFSCSRRDLERVYAYIERQREHHEKKTFREEYLELLKEYHIAYNERYVFKDIEG